MQQGAELQSLNTSPSAAMSLQATVISFEAVKGVKESFTVRKCTFIHQLLLQLYGTNTWPRPTLNT